MTLRIVIVDDQEVFRNVMERYVSDAVSPEVPEITKFEDAESALEFICKYLVDLVLTDLVMNPLYDGFELLKTLKSTPWTAEIPVIIVSRENDPEITTAALRAGAQDFWNKSTDRDQMRFRIRNVIGMMRSLREQRILIEENEQLRKRMSEHQLLMMMDSQVKAIDSAIAARDAKDMFVAMVSHEFRTPLQSIVSTVETLRRRLSKMDVDEDEMELLRPSMRRLLEDTEQLMVQAEDLGAFVRFEAGRSPYQFEPIHLRQFLEDILSVYSELADSKGLKLSYSCEELSIVADKSRVRQIISNLVSNAVKYTVEGTVDVSAHVENQGNESLESALVIVVSDTGIGVAREYHQSIFEPWFRTPQARAERGMGLGLSVVERLVNALKGGIEMQSSVGLGTKITVTLPLSHVEGLDESGSTGTKLDNARPSSSAIGLLVSGPAITPSPLVETGAERPRLGTRPAAQPPRVSRLPDIVLPRDTALAGLALVHAPVPSFNDKLTGIDFRDEAVIQDFRVLEPSGPGVSKAASSLPVLPLRTLVVDDTANLRAALLDALTDTGAVTGEAADGKQALEMITNGYFGEPWELLLLDLQMPEMSGYHVASKIREMRLPKRPIIVAMSAFELDENSSLAVREGRLFDLFVPKPVAILDLITRISAFARTSSPLCK